MSSPRDPQAAGGPKVPGGWRQAQLSAADEIAHALDAVAGLMTGLGFPQKDVFGVRLALEEALVNSVRHGHRYDPTKRVSLRYQVVPECALVEVEDEGPGFDPGQVPDPLAPENLERSSGRGLFLMRAYTSWLRHNERGNCVTLCQYPSAPPAAAASGAASSKEGGMAAELFAVERLPDTLVVTPLADLGELEYHRGESEAGQVYGLLNDPSVKHLVLDFRRTNYFGSSALCFFLRMWTRLRTRNGSMAFCNLSPKEEGILRVTRLDRLWPVCGSREEALRRVGAP